jgi:hypothetical protein
MDIVNETEVLEVVILPQETRAQQKMRLITAYIKRETTCNKVSADLKISGPR